MLYSEAAYFDGAAVQHIADYYEKRRIDRIRATRRKALDRGAPVLPRGCAGTLRSV